MAEGVQRAGEHARGRLSLQGHRRLRRFYEGDGAGCLHRLLSMVTKRSTAFVKGKAEHTCVMTCSCQVVALSLTEMWKDLSGIQWSEQWQSWWCL